MSIFPPTPGFTDDVSRSNLEYFSYTKNVCTAFHPWSCVAQNIFFLRELDAPRCSYMSCSTPRLFALGGHDLYLEVYPSDSTENNRKTSVGTLTCSICYMPFSITGLSILRGFREGAAGVASARTRPLHGVLEADRFGIRSARSTGTSCSIISPGVTPFGR